MMESVGRYRILEAIGCGEMGELYRARDTFLGRTVAIRIVTPQIAGDPERKERFLHDARASAALSHPNIAEVYEVAEDPVCFLAGEFVAGQPLKNVIGTRPLNPRPALDFAIQIADALADAAAADVAHGDLHTGNIIITSKGSAKILDFGLAAWTRSGAARADRTADHQDDILALGSILFMMLTGRKPVGVRTVTAINPSLPRELDPIVLKASAKKGSDRYGSAAALAAELRAVAAILDVRQEATEMEAGEPVRGTRSRLALIWLLAMLAIGALGWIVWVASRAT
jgi:serine/threonine-protein kinase